MADIVLSITIKEIYGPRVLEALNGAVGAKIAVATYMNGVGDSVIFTYPEQGSDTAKQFAERVLRNLFVSFVKAYELASDTTRFNSQIAGITPPVQTVPDDIIE